MDSVASQIARQITMAEDLVRLAGFVDHAEAWLQAHHIINPYPICNLCA